MFFLQIIIIHLYKKYSHLILFVYLKIIRQLTTINLVDYPELSSFLLSNNYINVSIEIIVTPSEPTMSTFQPPTYTLKYYSDSVEKSNILTNNNITINKNDNSIIKLINIIPTPSFIYTNTEFYILFNFYIKEIIYIRKKLFNYRILNYLFNIFNWIHFKIIILWTRTFLT